MLTSLASRSIRTLAWLGDAEFEREVRMRLAQRGDYSTDRLNSIKAKIVCAETQAELLHEILAELSEEEASVVRRARNQTLKSNGRKNFDVKTYRQATAFEALVAYWLYKDAQGKQRFEQLIGPYLEKYIDRALGNGKTAFVNNQSVVINELILSSKCRF